MTKQYVSVEPLTMVRIGSAETATMAYVYEGAPVPDGADPDDVARLVKEGYLEERDAADPEPDQPTTVEGILGAVVDDKALAQQYLDQENAAEKPRSTLVGKLQAIVDA
jgi:hypothetical protein